MDSRSIQALTADILRARRCENFLLQLPYVYVMQQSGIRLYL